MVHKISKITVHTTDPDGKAHEFHIDEKTENINWKKLGHTVGEVGGAVLKGVLDGATS